MIETVLFDFDMTLADSSYLIHHCVNLLGAHFGLRKVAYNEILKTIGLPFSKAVAVFWGECKSEWLNFPRSNFKVSQLSEDRKIRLFPNTLSTLKTLRKLGIKTAIATNRSYIRQPAKQLGIETLFDEIIGLSEGITPKPSPEILEYALVKLQSTKETAIYVGDTDIDIQTAKNAGVRVAGVTTGHFTHKQIKQLSANWVCSDLLEVVEIVKKDNGIG